MSGLKSSVKKLAVANQTRKYKKALKTKNMDYSAWIIQLENNQKDDFLIKDGIQKCLKNDFKKFVNESHSKENDENLAKSIQLCQQIDFLYNENGKNCQTQYLVCDPILLPQVNEFVKTPDNSVDCVIFKISDGNLSKFALREISEIFHRNKSLIMIYSDEDVITPSGRRENPWFKPDWAPDEFLSFFYFGGMVAILAPLLRKKFLKIGQISLFNCLHSSDPWPLSGESLSARRGCTGRHRNRLNLDSGHHDPAVLRN